MQVNKIKKYLGKMVIVKIGTKLGNPTKEYRGRIIRCLVFRSGNFVTAKFEQTSNYIEMKVWQSKTNKESQTIKTHTCVFKVVLEIVKVHSISLAGKINLYPNSNSKPLKFKKSLF